MAYGGADREAGNAKRSMPRVLMVGVGWPLPTFIARRIAALQGLHLPTMVALDRRHEGTDTLRLSRVFRERSRPEGLSLLLIAGLKNPARIKALMDALPGSAREKLSFLSRHPYLVSMPRPDIIHLQWIGSASTWAGVARALRIPLLASARGSQVTVEPHSPLKRQTIQRCLEAADAIHCVSEDIRAHCIRLGASPQKLFVNYNGIDTSFFSPGDRHRAPQDPFKMVSVGALIARKNIPSQLRVLQILRRSGLNARLALVGWGPDELVLRHIAAALGVDHAVDFLGTREEHEVAQILRQSDAYLSTSVAEGLANSVLEAAACGLPIVAFRCEGMGEVVLDGVSGYLHPYGDEESMAESLKCLAFDPEKCRKMGAAGRRLVCGNFEGRACALQMIEHYRRIAFGGERR